MIWFLVKYCVLSFLLIIGIVYINVDWWNEDSRRSTLLLLSWAASHGLATVSYLERGDWLTWSNKL